MPVYHEKPTPHPASTIMQPETPLPIPRMRYITTNDDILQRLEVLEELVENIYIAVFVLMMFLLFLWMIRVAHLV